MLSNGLSEEYFDQMMALLICLNENGSLILKELVIETGLPYPTLSNLIDRGEAIGVIERIKSTEDGRARKIQLTPYGENQIMPRIFKAREEADQVLTSNLSTSEKDDFIKLILKLPIHSNPNPHWIYLDFLLTVQRLIIFVTEF